MAAATGLEEAVAPMGALCGLVQDFVMGQQEGPADQVAAGPLWKMLNPELGLEEPSFCHRCCSSVTPCSRRRKWST
uniref:MMS19 cytosolic iron-sulfur assembly component n=1 Tax=Mus musculus TaxID=10090 RepID=E9PUY8_MOUSE